MARKPVKAKPITPAQFIRQHVLRMTIGQFAAALKVSQPTATYYEEQGRIPEIHRMVVRNIARRRGARLKLEWFDRVPFEEGVPHDR